MYVGEDTKKVENIVGAQMTDFRDVYKPFLEKMNDHVHMNWTTGHGMQDTSPSSKYHHLNLLPMNLQVVEYYYSHLILK